MPSPLSHLLRVGAVIQKTFITGPLLFFDDIGISLVKKILHIPDAVNIFTLVTY